MSKGAPKSESEFVALADAALRAVAGPNSRHAALIEDAFSVLVETPGGGVSIAGHGRDRARAREVVAAIAERIEAGDTVGEGDVRVAITNARAGDFPRGPGAKTPVTARRGGGIGPKTPAQANYLDLLSRFDLVFGVGPAGTGKTFLAIAMATAALARREVNRIILTRPAVEAGERLGFLPGDLMAKVDPYLRPLFDALHDMMEAEKVAAHLEKGVIEVAPLAFMRGRTLNDSFVILDEAQNTTPEQMKMFLTRLGFGSKMVVTGDITQIDLPREQQSGLVVVGDILTGVDGVEFVRFGGEDVVRHKLVQRIVAAYDEHASRQAPGLRPADKRRPA